MVLLAHVVTSLHFHCLDKPNKHVTGDPESTVFVARLSPDTTEGTLVVQKMFVNL